MMNAADPTPSSLATYVFRSAAGTTSAITLGLKQRMMYYAWTIMSDPANRPVTLRQKMSDHMVFAQPWKREPSNYADGVPVPKQEPMRERMRKGLLPNRSLPTPIYRTPLIDSYRNELLISWVTE